jgi:hypothetical protein
MNTCYSSRSTRLARLFSFDLLDGPQKVKVIKKRLAHHLAGAHRRGALYSARRAPSEKSR